MYLLNHIFTSKKKLQEFIKKENISSNQNILIQIFSSNRNFFDICQVKNELLELLPKVHIIGSSTAGAICDGKILDDKILISFSIFEQSHIKIKSFTNLSHEEIIEDLRKSVITYDSKLLICFADTFTFQPENFLAKLSKEFPHIKIAGGNGADDYNFESCFVFSTEDKKQDIVFACIDSKSLQIKEKYILNWLTLGKELTITKSVGNIIYEIDNINIFDMYKYYLGEDISIDPLLYMMEFPLIFKQNELEIARVPLKINEDNSMIFAGDIKVGTKVKFGYADTNYISQYNKNELLKDINSKNEAIYIYSCSARRSMLGSYLDDEISILNNSGNTTGFITYGEFFYNNSSKSTNLLNVTTTYLLLNENEVLPLEIIDTSNSTRNYQEIKTKVITSFLRTTTQEELQEINHTLICEKNKTTTILNNIPDLVWIKDKDGKYIACNNRFEEYIGTNKESLIGKSDYDFIDKKSADLFRENDLKALNSNTSETNFVNLVFANDKHEEFTFITKTKVTGLDGSIMGVLGVGKNITELKKKEEELTEQTDKYQNLMKYSSDAIFIVDLDGNLIECSNQFLKILGFDSKDLTNLNVCDFEALLSKDMIIDTINNLGFEPLSFETTYKKKNKTLLEVSVNIVKISLNNTIYVYGSFRDISHKKIFEEQSKLASMGQMIGNIAHQWRQPLSVITTIASSIKLWRENDLDDKINLIEGMETIMLQSNYLSKTIDDFRDFIKDNKEKNETHIIKVVEKALNIVHPTLKNNNITLIKNLKDDEKLEVYDNQLIQAIINIINNSKDAIKEHLVKNEKRLIYIETRKEKNKLNLIIKDNGKGIPTEILPKIFEPYFTTKHQSIGTGIGLSMVHKILTEHHLASIHVKNENFTHEDEEHFGACFNISFDLK